MGVAGRAPAGLPAAAFVRALAAGPRRSAGGQPAVPMVVRRRSVAGPGAGQATEPLACGTGQGRIAAKGAVEPVRATVNGFVPVTVTVTPPRSRWAPLVSTELKLVGWLPLGPHGCVRRSSPVHGGRPSTCTR